MITKIILFKLKKQLDIIIIFVVQIENKITNKIENKLFIIYFYKNIKLKNLIKI